MDKEFERLWWLFLLEVIIIVVVASKGGFNFITNVPFNSIIISISFLTFISVFYGFILGKVQTLEENFIQLMGGFKDEQWKKISESISKKDKDKDKINEAIQEIGRIEDFVSNINPKKWLFAATFSFMLSVIIFMVESGFKIPFMNISAYYVGATLFYFGVLFSFFLMNSLIILLVSENKAKERLKNLKRDTGIESDTLLREISGAKFIKT